MTFRRRIVVLAAGAVAAAIALAAVVTYVVVRDDLRAGVDASLRELRPKVMFVSRTSAAPGATGTPGRQDATAGPTRSSRPSCRRPALGGVAGIGAGRRCPTATSSAPRPGASLPTTAAVREVAAGKRGESLRDVTVHGVHVRVLTTRGPDGSTLQIAKPLTEVDDTLGPAALDPARRDHRRGRRRVRPGRRRLAGGDAAARPA